MLAAVERPAVERRRLAAAGGPQLVAHRVVDDAGEHALLVLDRDRDAPLRDPEQEVRGAVERVDDPAQPAAAARVRALLAEHPVVRPGGEQAVADQLLGRDVGLGDEVGRAALRLDPQLGLERRAQLGARRAGDLLGELDQSGGTRSAHGRAASIWAASETSVASSPGRRDELHGEREAVVGEAGGHRRGRLAGVVEGRAVRHPARVAVERPQRAAALVGADRDRALGEHRRHEDVGALEDGGDRARVGGLLRRARAASGGARDRAAQAAEALGAAREALGMGQLGRLGRRRRAK